MSSDNRAGAANAPAGLDYDEIEAAVMETERGRWFLGEFQRRHGHAEIDRLLAAVGRIEESMAAAPARGPDNEVVALRRAMSEMAEEIAETKREIAAIRPHDPHQGEISDATAELDAIVTSTESATSDILSAAEQIQELAWTMREEGAPAAYCDALDEKATEIYTACSFQDITGQRTNKVVRALQVLEARINAMAELWARGPETAANGGAELLSGPAAGGPGADQDAIDRVLAGEDDAGPAPERAQQRGVADDEADVPKLSPKDYDALFA